MACSNCEIFNRLGRIEKKLEDLIDHISAQVPIQAECESPCTPPTAIAPKRKISESESSGDEDIEVLQTRTDDLVQPSPPPIDTFRNGEVQLHNLDGPYVVGRVKPLYMNEEEPEDDEFHIRWLVDPNSLGKDEGENHFDKACTGYYFCDWSRQMVETSDEFQVLCDPAPDGYFTPKDNSAAQPFKIFPQLYVYGLDEVISLEEIKRLFFETPFDSEDQIEKKYDMIQLIEETFPEINFQFGRKENTIASEELRSWCVASEDPTASLCDIQNIRARKGRCDACNLSRVVSHQVGHLVLGIDCATRTKAILQLLADLNVSFTRPTEEDFNYFIFTLLDVMDNLKLLQSTSQKRKKTVPVRTEGIQTRASSKRARM